MHYEAQRLIEELGLQPHPEGGYFCEAYRSPISIETPRGKRLAITSIYYLLAGSMFSAFHRLASDEISRGTYCEVSAASAVDRTVDPSSRLTPTE